MTIVGEMHRPGGQTVCMGKGGYGEWEDGTVFLLTAQKEGEEIFFKHLYVSGTARWTLLSPYMPREVDVTVSKELSR